MTDRAIQHQRERAGMGEVELLPEQQAKLDIVMSWLVFHQPFFAHLLMAEVPVVATNEVPIAATDGFNIFINPKTFFEYSVPEQAFVMAHETMHCVFNDPILLHNWIKKGSVKVGTTDWPCDPNLLNIAMDFVINALLIEGKVGRFNSKWLYDAKFSKEGKEAAVNVYEQVLKEATVPSGAQFDFLLAPGAAKGEEPEEKCKERDELSWQQSIAAAAQAADMQGKLPSSMKRLIGEILDPKVSWQDHLRATVMRVSGSDGLDWSQADRRMLVRDRIGHEPIYFGRPTGFGCGTVVVGCDTSGSIGDKQIDQFFGELRGIFEDLNPREVVIMWCDAKVHRVDFCEEVGDLDVVRCKGAPGGGGTSFVPVFNRVEKLGLQPDMLIYLTDMYGTFPTEAPDYPTIWGSISPVKEAPFGEVIHVEV
jgi:predicted metal-dependent peptidase